MIAAIEKQKFVYMLNTDVDTKKMIVSSPLEAHKANTLTFDVVGLDNGYENPVFAAIEIDYGEVEDEEGPINTGVSTKVLSFYEVDLGLNHVVRKNCDVIDSSANLLIPVSGTSGPGGVVVCCEDVLVYKQYTDKKQEDLSVKIPKRLESKGNKTLITSFSQFKTKENYFFILQTELGDLFKLTLEHTNDSVHGLILSYFDTIPQSNSIALLVNGFLFSASETSNQ